MSIDDVPSQSITIGLASFSARRDAKGPAAARPLRALGALRGAGVGRSKEAEAASSSESLCTDAGESLRLRASLTPAVRSTPFHIPSIGKNRANFGRRGVKKPWHVEYCIVSYRTEYGVN